MNDPKIGEKIRDKLAQRIDAFLGDSENVIDGALITAISRFLDREGVKTLASENQGDEAAAVKKQAESAEKKLRKLG